MERSEGGSWWGPEEDSRCVVQGLSPSVEEEEHPNTGWCAGSPGTVGVCFECGPCGAVVALAVGPCRASGAEAC